MNRTLIVGVEVHGGWWFALWRRDDVQPAAFDVALSRPHERRDRPGWSFALKPSIGAAIEAAAEHLSRELGIPAARIAEHLASTLDVASP